MKAIKNIFLVLGILVTVSGCDYLDSEPEKKGTLEEAFASVNSARNFLYACYSFMPESSIIIGLISKVLHNRVVAKRTIFMALFVNAIHF